MSLTSNCRPRLTRCLPGWVTPARAAFIGSLLLSVIAHLGSELNRDGIAYVFTAEIFLRDGFAAAKANFNWPFMSVAMALLSRLSGLGVAHAGYLMNAVFMAGACSLMVSIAARARPEVAWMTCLAVLALPGLNEYRNELLREYGCWFFMMLSFWLAIRWSEHVDWKLALAAQLSLALAALFRPEAVTLYAALVVWQLFSARGRLRWQRALLIGALPAAAVALLVALFLFGPLAGDPRLTFEIGRLNAARFDAKAQILAGGLIDYARGNASAILFFGSLALIPIKLVQKFGIFLLPLAYLVAARGLREPLSRLPLFGWAIVFHLLLLVVFVNDLQFLAGRYVALILLLSAPFVGMGLHLVVVRFPRVRAPLIVALLTFALTNVVSTGQSKEYFVDAGRWLADTVITPEELYIDSGRALFHAGWYGLPHPLRDDRPGIAAAARSGKYRLFVLERSRKDPPLDEWLAVNGLRVVRRFGVEGKDEVVVAEPTGASP